MFTHKPISPEGSASIAAPARYLNPSGFRCDLVEREHAARHRTSHHEKLTALFTRFAWGSAALGPRSGSHGVRYGSAGFVTLSDFPNFCL
jgi:hypothetical protein